MTVNDRERVGKRRRVTEEDRSRQAAPVKQAISPEFCHMRTKRRRAERSPTSSVILDDISIRIGRPQQHGISRMQGHLPDLSQESSEQMLLDKEEAKYLHQLPNTPTRPHLKHLSPYIDPYTPQQVSQPPSSLTRRLNTSTIFPHMRGADYNRIADNSLNSSISRLSSKPSTHDSIAKRPNVTVNGFLSSTPGSIGSKSFHGLENQRHGRGIDRQARSGPYQGRFQNPRGSQARNIPGNAIADTISTSSSQIGTVDYGYMISEDGLPTHSIEKSPSVSQNSSNLSFGSKKARRSRASPVNVASETEQIYKSIETDDENAGPAFVVDFPRHKELDGMGKTDGSSNQGRISNTIMSDKTTTKPQLEGIHDKERGSPSPPTIFGQRLHERATHIPRKEDSWMKFIFEPEIGNKDLQSHHLDTGIARGKYKTKSKGQDLGTDSSILEETTRRHAGNVETSSNAKSTGKTSANTSLNDGIPSATNVEFASETDFLSNLSPMEGFLDENLAHISVYNNAPRTVRSPSPLSTTSVFDCEKNNPYQAHHQREGWDSRSPPPYPEQSAGASISMMNQPAISAHGQGISSPDPLSMVHDHDLGKTLAENTHVGPRRAAPPQRKLWISSPDNLMT